MKEPAKRFSFIKKTVFTKGFTFIEILVVITIIGVLTTIGAVSYQSANKKSRDAKRKKDLEQLRFTIEDYRSANFFYSGSADGGKIYSSCDGANWLPEDLRGSFPDGISDPLNQSPYCYFYAVSGDNRSFELNAVLEIDSSGKTDNGNDSDVYEIGNNLEII
jgi:prepilin-type N-terminal cleavage/methylation domain-containing protein